MLVTDAVKRLSRHLERRPVSLFENQEQGVIQTSEQVLTSLAILKVNWDRGRDYIENFVPFVAESLRTSPQAEVSLPQLQAAITETFGFRIPQGALRTILRRAERRGYVDQTGGIYRRNDHKLAAFTLGPARNGVLRLHEALISKFLEFCGTRYEVSWSREEAESAILAYLQGGSAAILTTAVTGQPLLPAASPIKHADFLINAFVVHLHESDPERFASLETLVKGNILANVLFFPDLSGVGQRFDRVEFYLDTKFLLRALGLAGESMEAASRELLDLLYEQNALLRCFDRTLDEVFGILQANVHLLQNPDGLRRAYGETLEYMIRSQYTPSDVERIKATLEERLHTLRIRVKPRPPYSAASGAVDEEKLESSMKEKIGYRSPDALRHDLDALTAIHRLRRGQFPRRIELADAVFVTTNSSLVRSSMDFFRGEYGDAAGWIPHAILDHVLTTIVWLKNPLLAPELPRKRIIADAYAALNPPDDLWRAYLNEIDRLQRQGKISEEEYNLLRFSTVARTALMDRTLGEADVFTEGTIQEVLERAQAAARAQVEEALQIERAQREEAERRRAEAEERAARAEARAEAQRQAQLQRFQQIGTKAGWWVSQIVLFGGILLTGTAVYVTLPRPFPSFPREWEALVLPALLVVLLVFGVLTIANLSFGTTLRVLARRLEIAVSRFIERRLGRMTEPN